MIAGRALDEAPGEPGTDPDFVIVRQPQAAPLPLLGLFSSSIGFCTFHFLIKERLSI